MCADRYRDLWLPLFLSVTVSHALIVLDDDNIVTVNNSNTVDEGRIIMAQRKSTINNASASIKNQRVANSVRSKSFNWGLLMKGEKKVAPERV